MTLFDSVLVLQDLSCKRQLHLQITRNVKACPEPAEGMRYERERVTSVNHLLPSPYWFAIVGINRSEAGECIGRDENNE